MTVLEAIQRGADFLARKGVDSPRLQTEWLLAHALALPRLQLYLQFERVLTESEVTSVRELLRRRGAREPLQHLLGTAVFCGLEFQVGPVVLVPRPETEGLAEKACQLLAQRGGRPTRVLDFGTGSGCLAVTIALRVPEVTCDAVDISLEALTIARENADRLGASDRVRFHAGDGFAALPPDLRFDLIVSNPPYIPSSDLAGLEPEVRDHEPRLALDGGEDGLVFYRRLGAEGGRWLAPGGTLLIELGDGQAEAVSAVFAGHNWVVAGIEADYNGRPRVLEARPGPPPPGGSGLAG